MLAAVGLRAVEGRVGSTLLMQLLASSPDLGDLERCALAHLWSACSEAMLERDPSARWYAEKLAVPAQPIIDAGVPLRLIDCVRDPRDILVSIRAFTAAFGRASRLSSLVQRPWRTAGEASVGRG